MPQKHSFTLKSVLLRFLLIFGIFCDAQVNREEVKKPPDAQEGDDGAFFALRSCHQLLNGDNGEFFSPDYLCSNPPLWCNWTIQVPPGKRIHLHLEDLTPDDACIFKEDQIHVDEPAGYVGGHKVLQKCWQEAKYTSTFNTLYVVLLIGGWPSPPYRGFHGRYQAFGPPVVYNPQDGLTERDKESETSHELSDFNKFQPVTAGEQMVSDLVERPAPVYDYYDQPVAMTTGPPWEDTDTDTKLGKNYHQDSENYSHHNPFTVVPTELVTTLGTFRSGRGAAQTTSDQSDPVAHPASPQEQHDNRGYHLEPPPHTTTAIQSNAEEALTLPEEAAVPEDVSLQSLSDKGKSANGSEGKNRMEVSQVSDQHPPASEAPEPEQTYPHPAMVELLSDHRGSLNIRNQSETPHLPGDHLFEVAVEVNFSQDFEESFDDRARSLLMSVKALISEQLEALHTPLFMTSKRIKRLNAGVLYILWLQIERGPGGPQVHRAVLSAVQGLIATGFSFRGNHKKAVIMSVSTADVNECGTQLVLCDINAECVNHFGSYSCHCKPDFQDESRLGSGGTVCVEVKTTGCSSGFSAETKGVYVLFFLLSSLVLIMLVAAGTLYHRHHRGGFLVRCHSSSSISPPDPNSSNNNQHHYRDDGYSIPTEYDQLPPPPPARGPREGWPHVKEHHPAVDLPLLRFSPLLQPDGYTAPQEGGKM